jgi:hypothetical protein
MTKMTQNGASTTTQLGTEQYEEFTIGYGRRGKKVIQYDYRHTDGELFSCVKLNLELCRAARDLWLAKNKK